MLRGKASLSAAVLLGFVALHAWPARAADVLFKNLNQQPGGTTRLLNTTDRVASDFTTDGKTSVVQSAIVMAFNNNLTNDFTPHSFTLSIYTNNAGAPGTVVGTFNAFSLSAAQSHQTKLTTTTDPGGIPLAANTTYWGVLQINETASTEFSGWSRVANQNIDAGSLFTTVAATQILVSTNSGSSWSNATSGTGNTIFQLSGLAPEPAVFGPLGLLGALLMRRKPDNRTPGRA